MNQEITLTPKLIKYFTANLPAYLEENNAQKMIKLFRENYFVVDERRDLFNKIWSETNDIKDEQLQKAIKSLIEWCFKQRARKVVPKFTSYEKLSAESIDKILLSPFSDDFERMRDKINFSIETHNDTSFIDPKVTDRLKHNSSVLRLNKNEVYDIKILLEPYLRNIKKIIIKDPFLPNDKAFNNLKKIVNFCNCSIFELWIHSKKNYCEDKNWKQKNYSSFVEYAEKYKPKLFLKFYPIRKHYDRYIITEKTKITLPGGLDFLDRNGKITSTENTVEIVVKPN